MASIRVKCECGSEINKSGLRQHQRSLKHMKFVQKPVQKPVQKHVQPILAAIIKQEMDTGRDKYSERLTNIRDAISDLISDVRDLYNADMTERRDRMVNLVLRK